MGVIACLLTRIGMRPEELSETEQMRTPMMFVGLMYPCKIESIHVATMIKGHIMLKCGTIPLLFSSFVLREMLEFQILGALLPKSATVAQDDGLHSIKCRFGFSLFSWRIHSFLG